MVKLFSYKRMCENDIINITGARIFETNVRCQLRVDAENAKQASGLALLMFYRYTPYVVVVNLHLTWALHSMGQL